MNGTPGQGSPPTAFYSSYNLDEVCEEDIVHSQQPRLCSVPDVVTFLTVWEDEGISESGHRVSGVAATVLGPGCWETREVAYLPSHSSDVADNPSSSRGNPCEVISPSRTPNDAFFSCTWTPVGQRVRGVTGGTDFTAGVLASAGLLAYRLPCQSLYSCTLLDPYWRASDATPSPFQWGHSQ